MGKHGDLLHNFQTLPLKEEEKRFRDDASRPLSGRSQPTADDMHTMMCRGYFWEKDGHPYPEPEFKSMNNWWRAWLTGVSAAIRK